MRCARLFALLTLVWSAGCKFDRTVVNEHVRRLDTSWIVPGETTRADVIDRLGVSPSLQEGGGVTGNSFRWICADTFTGSFEGGYIVSPTFARGTMHYAEDILVVFDSRGVVELLSRTRCRDGKTVEIVEWKERAK